MTYLDAADATLRELRSATHLDATVQLALELALYAWQHCDCSGLAQASWDLFGTDVHATTAALYPTATLTIALGNEQLPDSPAVRDRAARLAVAAAATLEAAAGDPTADPAARWTWSTATVRLTRAAAELTPPA